MCNHSLPSHVSHYKRMDHGVSCQLFFRLFPSAVLLVYYYLTLYSLMMAIQIVDTDSMCDQYQRDIFFISFFYIEVGQKGSMKVNVLSMIIGIINTLIK